MDMEPSENNLTIPDEVLLKAKQRRRERIASMSAEDKQKEFQEIRAHYTRNAVESEMEFRRAAARYADRVFSR